MSRSSRSTVTSNLPDVTLNRRSIGSVTRCPGGRTVLTAVCCALLALTAVACGEQADDLSAADDSEQLEASPAAQLAADPAPAQPQVTVGLLRQAERADLVFHGVIETIEHQSLFETLPSGVRAEWPQTYVTYRVLAGIKGGAPGERITLRFLGGPMQDGKRMVAASNVPLFNVGNSDILFVKQNGLWWCPLANSERGLFRVVDGAVYSHDGHAMVLDRGRLLEGAPRDLPQARVSFVRGRRFERVRGGREASAPPSRSPRAAVGLATFIDSVRRAVAGKPIPFASARALSVGFDHPLAGGPGRGR